jgi:hypothetical protein
MVVTAWMLPEREQLVNTPVRSTSHNLKIIRPEAQL